MTKFFSAFNFLLLFLVFGSELIAQQNEEGLPYIDYFSPADYRAGSYNYNIIQDEKGIYYFSNEEGVLMYNGVSWNLIPVTKNKPVYWVQEGADGIIYVGSAGELGFLKQTANGRLSYHSLMDRIDPEYHDFASVWEIACSSREVVFRSRKYIFSLQGSEMSVLETSERGFDVAFTVRDTVYTRVRGEGIYYVDNHRLVPMDGGAFFAEIKVNIFLPFGEEGLLVGTRHDGLFIVSNGVVEPFETEADTFLKEHHVYHGCVTYNGNFAFAAYAKGIAIVNADGELIQLMSGKTGLIDFQYLFVNMFDANNMWVANGVGVSKIKMQSPTTYFNSVSGLRDVATDVVRYKGDIYISTLRNLYKLVQSEESNQFVKINPFHFGEIYSIEKRSDELLVGSQEGLFIYDGDSFENLGTRWISEMIVAENGNTVFAGTDETGFSILTFEGSKLAIKDLEDFNETVKEIIEQEDQLLVLSHQGSLAATSNINNEALVVKKRVELGSSDMVEVGTDIIVASREEYYILDDRGEVTDVHPLQLSHDVSKVHSIEVIDDHLLWICYQDELRRNYCDQVIYSNGELSLTGIGFNPGFPVNAIYEDEHRVSWFAGNGGTIRYDRNIPAQNSDQPFQCFIDQLVWNQDSVLFQNGYSSIPKVIFPPDVTDLRFSFFTNEAGSAIDNYYQYQLVGRDNNWSSWSKEWKKDYTSLPAGNYTFKVRAKNALNIVSSADQFSFSIEQPWYFSIWSISWFGLMFIGFVFGVFKIRMAQLKEDKLRLERLIQSRTKEVERQKMDLEAQQTVLKNANDTKTQLFSIIGHDLRSPLNSIQGLTELIQHYRQEKEPEMVDKMMIHLSDSVKRLSHLLDNLLTWALNQSGNFKVNPELIKMDFLMKEIVSVLVESAHAKEIEIKVNGPKDGLLHADKNSLSTVLRNIINNAIKFSHQGGEIRVNYECSPLETVITIKDDGIGIPKDKLDEIFELTHTTFGTNNEKGTGLGLVLVSEFVALNGGSLEVFSEEGKGAEFVLKFPNH